MERANWAQKQVWRDSRSERTEENWGRGASSSVPPRLVLLSRARRDARPLDYHHHHHHHHHHRHHHHHHHHHRAFLLHISLRIRIAQICRLRIQNEDRLRWICSSQFATLEYMRLITDSLTLYYLLLHIYLYENTTKLFSKHEFFYWFMFRVLPIINIKKYVFKFCWNDFFWRLPPWWIDQCCLCNAYTMSVWSCIRFSTW